MGHLCCVWLPRARPHLRGNGVCLSLRKCDRRLQVPPLWPRVLALWIEWFLRLHRCTVFAQDSVAAFSVPPRLWGRLPHTAALPKGPFVHCQPLAHTGVVTAAFSLHQMSSHSTVLSFVIRPLSANGDPALQVGSGNEARELLCVEDQSRLHREYRVSLGYVPRNN